MKSIISLIDKKYLSKVKTTKDLIYKDKSVDVHNIKKSYEELASLSKYMKSLITYGDQSLYYNETADNLYKLGIDTLNFSSKITDSENYDIKSEISKFILSEIQNSLWIEGVKSSKKTIKQTLKNPSINAKEYISKYANNYNEALNFILSTDTLNKNTLFTLYNIITKDIDMGKEALDGFPYRQEEVDIGDDYKGIHASKIESSIDSIFKLFAIDEETGNKDEKIFDALHNFINIFLVHYLFEIVHPYYDMNGRTGRLLSLWVAKKYKILHHVLYYSEAINLYKKNYYYKAFEKSSISDFKFDATYFVSSSISVLYAYKISYSIYKLIKSKIMNEYKVKFSGIEKDIIISLLNKEVDKFYKAQEIVLGHDEINPATISKAFKNLENWGAIEAINSNPKEYKVVWTDKMITSVKETLEKNAEVSE